MTGYPVIKRSELYIYAKTWPDLKNPPSERSQKQKPL
jgi:hypothetical protein